MKTLKLADDLEKVLTGRLSMDAVLENREYWPDLDACNHGLQHFAMDNDLRAEQPEYKQMQEDELKLLISLLRTGAPESEIGKVHFLGYSRKKQRGSFNSI